MTIFSLTAAHFKWDNFGDARSLRPGHASDECGCEEEVGPLPDELRYPNVYNNYGEYGIDTFYQKYLHAYGIPILGMYPSEQ